MCKTVWSPLHLQFWPFICKVLGKNQTNANIPKKQTNYGARSIRNVLFFNKAELVEKIIGIAEKRFSRKNKCITEQIDNFIYTFVRNPILD